MGSASRCSSISQTFSSNVKVLALESTLQQCIINFKELLTDFEELQLECGSHKQQISILKDKCDSKTCCGSEELKKVIETKNQIIQSVGSSLTKLNDTKDWNVITEIFKLLFGDTSPAPQGKSPTYSPEKTKTEQLSVQVISPKIENVSITDDVSFKEESLCEIEGTPTGRTSPIIHTKKCKNIVGKATDFRDKKKCPNEWPTPESKQIKLTFHTPPTRKSRRLRQSRLDLVSLRQTSVVDLTCSPECSGTGKPLVKKESLENDDTILPSPTSGPTNFTMLKNSSKNSPSKFKRPALSLVKSEKREKQPKHDENKDTTKDSTNTSMEDSINILNPLQNRFNNIKKEQRPEEVPSPSTAMDADATHCDTNSSVSLLNHGNQPTAFTSPVKCPLAENINIMNTPPKVAESSMSLLHKAPPPAPAVENVRRKLPELVEPVYKEPTVRNKLEKRNLQGWSCEQCKNFYGELYKNDPVMLAKKINECSKHRGRHNPERPKTPPNFWNPRWHVPTDTEELNRLNNAN